MINITPDDDLQVLRSELEAIITNLNLPSEVRLEAILRHIKIFHTDSELYNNEFIQELIVKRGI